MDWSCFCVSLLPVPCSMPDSKRLLAMAGLLCKLGAA